MTTEFVLLLGLAAFIIGGAFYTDSGPMSTFSKAGPRLGAKVEQNLSIGNGPEGFQDKNTGVARAYWQSPENQ